MQASEGTWPNAADGCPVGEGTGTIAEEIRALDQRVQELVRVDAQQALRLADVAVGLSVRADAFHAGVAIRAQARALRLLARYKDSVARFATAAERFADAGDQVELARTLVGKVDALMYLGQYSEALDTAVRARKVLHRAGDLLGVAKLDMNVGNVYFHLDDASHALRHYRRAERAFRALNDELQVAAAEANVGNALVQLDRFGAALYHLARSRGRYARLDLPLMVAIVDLNIGYTWSCRGFHLKALEHLLRARHVFLKQGVQANVATTDLDIAQSYLALNMVSETVETCREAAQIFETEGMARERGQALVYEAEAVSEVDSIRACDLLWQARQIFDVEHNQTWCAIVDLHLSSLVPEGEEALALAEQATRVLSGLGLRRRAAEGRMAWARAIECLGDVRQARNLYRRVSADASTLGLAELRVRALHAQARLDRSLPLYREVAHQLETLRPALGTESLKAGFSSRTRELYEEMLELLIAEGASVDEVFATVEAARARTLGDDMTMRKVRRNASTSPEQSNTERLRQYVRSLQTRLRDAELSTRSEEVERLQIETTSAERELVRRLQEEAIFKSARGEPRGSGVITLRDVQSCLEPDQMLVEYFSISNCLLALCVSRDRADIYPNLTTTGDVATLAAKLRFQFNACARGGEGWVSRQGERLLTRAQTYLQRLYEQLLAPLDLSSAQHVIIVPHGPLHGIPFHALHDGTAYLVEQREIAVTPSATVSFGRSKGDPASGAPLVVGAEDQYAPLVANEAREVARRLHVRPYVDTRATRSAFMRRAPTASIIHLAAHASLRPDNPQFSAIHFADGPLTVHDLSGLRLRARLAVLSACATGVGAWREDDEVVSLARAFLAAGVERLLVSLWPVWDRTTTTMMTVFYEDLASAGSVGAALRRAQLHVRELSPHPYYWASFTEVR